MTHALADVEPVPRWRSTSGRAELVDDQGGLRLLMYGQGNTGVLTGTDWLDAGDVDRLALALATDRTHWHAIKAAHVVTEDADTYSLFIPEHQLPVRAVVRCEDCRRTVREPMPWWEFQLGTSGRFVQLGPRCFAKRQAARERAARRGDQLALHTNQEGGYMP